MAVTLVYPYTTLALVKAKCGIGSTDTAWDDDINRSINKMSRYIDRMTQRYFYKKTFTSEYLNGTKNYDGWQILKADTGGLLLTPQMAPIISVTSIAENSTSLTENTDYYLHKAEGIIERAGTDWDEDPRAILITCELGYEDDDDTTAPSDDIPGDIAYYACELAARDCGRYKKEIKNYVSGASEPIDLFGVPKEIEKALKDLRPVIIG